MSTAEYVVDSWAWVEYLRGGASGRSVRVAVEGGARLLTTPITLAEIVSKFAREGLDREEASRAIGSLARIDPITQEDAKEAGSIHAQVKKETRNFSLGDAFVLQLARKRNAKVLTGDPDFRGLPEAEMISGARRV
jgi:predicted nucleic acid-binding protein